MAEFNSASATGQQGYGSSGLTNQIDGQGRDTLGSTGTGSYETTGGSLNTNTDSMTGSGSGAGSYGATGTNSMNTSGTDSYGANGGGMNTTGTGMSTTGSSGLSGIGNGSHGATGHSGYGTSDAGVGGLNGNSTSHSGYGTSDAGVSGLTGNTTTSSGNLSGTTYNDHHHATTAGNGKDSTMGKIMQKAGSVLHNEKLEQKGLDKREEVAATTPATY